MKEDLKNPAGFIYVEGFKGIINPEYKYLMRTTYSEEVLIYSIENKSMLLEPVPKLIDCALMRTVLEQPRFNTVFAR
ncbi:MAG: hypothetical protein LBE10_13245 [Treponema sp.]|jgi:hypothetical protein|nr:hypothetical protein [Treponema sp.]